MIFVTVGLQTPFDRLVRAVDGWAADRKRDDVFAQVAIGGWCPEHVASQEILEPDEFRQQLVEADVVVTHAGVGSILTVLGFAKPMILVPRRPDDDGVTDDHQLVTARALDGRTGIRIAWDDRALVAALDAVRPAARRTRQREPRHRGTLEIVETLRRMVRDDAPLIPHDPTGPLGRIGLTDDQSPGEPRKAASSRTSLSAP